jgi:putative ABC transport system ATP-binding protein
MPPEPPAVEARGLTRTYAAAGGPVRGLHEVSLEVARGEVLAVTGPSGSGKSTLLFLLAGLDRPDGGQALVAGTDWSTLAGPARAGFRRRACGFIAQGMALLPQATAAENVEVPLLLDGVAPRLRGARAAEALAAVGLAGEAAKLPDQLSGGQQQRVAIARALVARPAVVLADEPTANLDSATAQAVTRLLLATARERGAAVLLVTHDPEVAGRADRLVRLRAGQVAGSLSTGGLGWSPPDPPARGGP